jgi:catechol 2,3-dioxygenase-like lactoylglutathione lyase family enzyme
VIDHVSIGVTDVAASKRFYDAALAPLGITCLRSSADGLGYGRERPQFWVSATTRPVPADDQSGLHICFDAARRADVDAFHEASLRAGGRDNGKPGIRPEYSGTYYAAFVVDPTGYRIEAYCARAK